MWNRVASSITKTAEVNELELAIILVAEHFEILRIARLLDLPDRSEGLGEMELGIAAELNSFVFLRVVNDEENTLITQA